MNPTFSMRAALFGVFFLAACQKPQKCIEQVSVTSTGSRPEPAPPLTARAPLHAEAFRRLSERISMLALQTQNVEHNAAVSPVALGCAVAMLESGAPAATRDREVEQASRVLKSLTQARPSIQMSIANRLFVPPSIAIGAELARGLEQDFLSPPGALTLSAPRSIALVNDWIAEHTQHQIASLLPESAAKQRSVVVSAATATARWATAFTAPKSATFTLRDAAQIEVPTLAGNVSALVRSFLPKGARTTLRVLELPFEGWEGSLLLHVPNADDDWQAAEQAFFHEAGVLTEVHIAADEETWVGVSLPAFRMHSPAGVFSAESLAAFPWLSGNTGSTAHAPPRIDQLVHQVNVRVDENGLGVDAKAARGPDPEVHAQVEEALRDVQGMLAPGGFPREPGTSFVVDRPFLYKVLDRNSQLILFAGRVLDPR